MKRKSSFSMRTAALAAVVAVAGFIGVDVSPVARAQTRSTAEETIPSFDELLAHKVALKPELVGVHPRVFVTRAGLDALRERSKTTHRAQWTKVLANLPALQGPPPPPPGPQARRSQNNAAFAIAGVSLAYAVEREAKYLDAAKAWTLAAIDYEPWGYTYNKPNVDLAAGHLLYAIGWAYDLLYDEWTEDERARIRASLERHATLVYDYFAPAKPGESRKRFNFTQNHDFIPTAGLAVTALALMGESKDAEKWAVLARAHHHRAGQLLSPDGYYYESMEYWIFSTPWLVHFLDAWEHATGESLWSRDVFRNWKHYLAHVLMPDGQTVFDFGDIWEGAKTRARQGEDYARAYPGGTLQSNFNHMWRVASRLRDPEAQAVAERYASFGHSNLEEYWTLLWRDPSLKPAPMSAIPLARHFEDSGVYFQRSSWGMDALAFAYKASPPEGHRVTRLLSRIPEWRLSSGHAHPDAGSFIVWAHGAYLTGDTGYAGIPSSRNHNTLTIGGVGQGVEDNHDVFRSIPQEQLAKIRISSVKRDGERVTIESDIGSAYPTKAGLRSARRTFTFDGATTFGVTDRVALSEPGNVEWRLQSDEPFAATSTPFKTGRANGPTLDVSFRSPSSFTFATERGQIKTPGPPGSIETGPVEERGHVLVASTKSTATNVSIDATLVVRPPKQATKDEIVKTMTSVADWQLANPSRHRTWAWHQAPFWASLDVLAPLVPNGATYLEAIRKNAEANEWKPGPDLFHADDLAITQSYFLLHRRDPQKDPKQIAGALERFDLMLQQPFDRPLLFDQKMTSLEWNWCDALFMAPPAMALATAATGDRRYLDQMDRLFWKTTDYLFDKDESLYYRDSRYFDTREPNGRKTFWSRGNGWVIAGIARVLQYAPHDFASRPKYVELFKAMAKKVATLQGPDGYWRTSLLDPDALPLPETSGTGFYTYALAWGVNEGLLDRATYEPVILRGWQALARAVHTDGKLGYVQPVGAAPGATTAEMTEIYGAGALILAGSEVVKLLGR
jgi:rhamnogalacturonyl hydrolase YesR